MGSGRPEDEDGGLLLRCRPNSRSLDISSTSCSSREPSKAAAWIWHMHSTTSSKTDTEDTPAISHTKKRSTSFDRKNSRFRQEAAAASASSSTSKPSPLSKFQQDPQANIWDCGSKLYDTFELVSFSNWLDRGMLDIPAFSAPQYPHPAQTPLHHRGFAGVLRTFSLPRSFSTQNLSTPVAPPHVKPASHDVSASNLNINEASSASMSRHSSRAHLQGTTTASAARIQQKPSASWRVVSNKWTLSKLAKILKKAKALCKHMQCFRPRASSHAIRRAELMDGDIHGGMPDHKLYRAYEEKVYEGSDGGRKHFHHHHHHYHHHFVHHNIDQISPAAKEDNVCKPPLDSTGSDGGGAGGAVRSGQRAESARLSSDTLFKICADVNWV